MTEIGSPDYLDGERTPLPKTSKILTNCLIISNQISCVIFTFLTYYNLKDLNLESNSKIYQVLIFTTLALILGSFYSKIRVSIFFQYYYAIILYTFVFTPILLTLTRSISSDTILRLIVLFLFLHLLTYNYFTQKKSIHEDDDQNEESENVSIYSTNFATLAIIFMISRFDFNSDDQDDADTYENPTNDKIDQNNLQIYDFLYFKTFAMIILAIQLLLLWPILRSKLAQNESSNLQIFINFSMILVSLVYSWFYSWVAFLVGLFLHFLVGWGGFLLVYYDKLYRREVGVYQDVKLHILSNICK